MGFYTAISIYSPQKQDFNIELPLLSIESRCNSRLPPILRRVALDVQQLHFLSLLNSSE